MSSVPAESVALHLVRHLVRGLGKTEGQAISIQSLRHWRMVSLGQRGDDLELGLDYAVNHHWLERKSDNVIVLTSQRSEKGAMTR
ncbi:hypothetical protein [Microvirga yunnanensis]|uniref:hypothetical protein n=1 Tax=Microvirga yunnanensis TaxID=2953740 RepID=UPI0021CA381E|nr:hypothetical protein [Microvirga sp. HBU65207]